MRLTIGVSFTHTDGEQLRIGFIKALREFLDNGGLARWWELQIRQPPSDFRFPVRHVRFLPRVCQAFQLSGKHIRPRWRCFLPRPRHAAARDTD